jgi:adenylosuccinate lyase
MISESLENIYLPGLEEIIKKIGKLAKDNKNVPMLARTHGQPASPTTFGKEFKIFEERLKRQINQLKNHKIFKEWILRQYGSIYLIERK